MALAARIISIPSCFTRIPSIIDVTALCLTLTTADIGHDIDTLTPHGNDHVKIRVAEL